jgi:predicted metallopeptidase
MSQTNKDYKRLERLERIKVIITSLISLIRTKVYARAGMRVHAPARI